MVFKKPFLLPDGVISSGDGEFKCRGATLYIPSGVEEVCHSHTGPDGQGMSSFHFFTSPIYLFSSFPLAIYPSLFLPPEPLHPYIFLEKNRINSKNIYC